MANVDSTRPLLVRAIEQMGPTTLGIQWTDGHASQWQIAHLLRHCQCASCIDEWTREKLLDPATVKDDLKAIQIDSVGRYALTITFADGHNTGIYPFTRLRELCLCEKCSGSDPMNLDFFCFDNSWLRVLGCVEISTIL